VLIMLCISWTEYGRLHAGSFADVRYWVLAVSVLAGTTLTAHMLSLTYANVGLVMMGGSLSPALTLILEMLLQERINIGWDGVSALIVATVGAIIYASWDLRTSSTFGVATTVVYVLSGVLTQLMQRRLLALDKVDISHGLGVVLNNVTTLLPVSITMVALKEEKSWSAAFASMKGSDIVLLVVSCGLGMAVSMTTLAAQRLVTATTFSVLQILNNFLTIAGSAILLSEAYGAVEVVGVAINIAGGAWYVASQARRRVAKDEAVAPPLITRLLALVRGDGAGAATPVSAVAAASGTIPLAHKTTDDVARGESQAHVST
jgi:drug/metabolite transporter (DMT)-like permease